MIHSSEIMHKLAQATAKTSKILQEIKKRQQKKKRLRGNFSRKPPKGTLNCNMLRARVKCASPCFTNIMWQTEKKLKTAQRTTEYPE